MKVVKVLKNEELVLILLLLSYVYHKLLKGLDGKNEDNVGYNDACYLLDAISDLLVEAVNLYGQNILSDMMED